MRPKTVPECWDLPEAKIIDDRYPYLGGEGVTGDGITLFLDRDGTKKRVECRRGAADGPDVWVKVRGS